MIKNTVFTLFCVLISPLLVKAQTGAFSFSGKIGNIKPATKIYLDYTDDAHSHEDSTTIQNGEFLFKGTLNGIASARMTLDHENKGKSFAIYKGGDVIYFYFGAEGILLSSSDSLVNSKISGSNTYDRFKNYTQFIGGSMMDLTKAANIDFSSGTEAQQKDSVYISAVNERFHRRITRRAERQFVYAKEHPDDFFGLVALSEAAGAKVDIARVKPLFDALDKKLQQTDMGKELAQRINAVRLTGVGNVAPAFVQNDQNGKPLSLTSLKGKVILIDFWASWCAPCRAENPNLGQQYKLYKNKGFEIISVSLDTDKKSWLNAIQKDNMPWLHVSDLKGWNNQVGRLYGIRAVPACFLVDREGKIIANDVRGETLNAKLAELFGTNK